MAPDIKERFETTIVSNTLHSVGFGFKRQCLPLSHCASTLFRTEVCKRRKQCLAKIFPYYNIA